MYSAPSLLQRSPVVAVIEFFFGKFVNDLPDNNNGLTSRLHLYKRNLFVTGHELQDNLSL